MQKKYFYNSEVDLLVIVDIENGEATGVLELSDPLTVDYDDEDSGDDEEESADEDAEITSTETVPVAPVRKTEKKKRESHYNREAVKAAILRGDKPAKIAKENDTSVGTIYQIKSEMKKAGELEADAPSKGHEVQLHPDQFVAKMILMLREGKSDQEIYESMYMSITDAQYREKLEIAKREK